MATDFRALENREGAVFDEADLKRIYAEDWAQVTGAINALENKIGNVTDFVDVVAPVGLTALNTPDGDGLFRVSFYAYVNPSDASAGVVRFRFRAYTGIMFHQEYSADFSLAGLNQISGSFVLRRSASAIQYAIEQVSGGFGTAKISGKIVVEKII